MKTPYLLLLLAAIVPSLNNCGNSDGRTRDREGVPVVATTTMIADMTARIGGAEIRLTGLMAPGVDPHTYNLPARSIAQLRKAKAVFYNGLKLEGRTEELFTARRGEAIVRALGDAVPANRLHAPEAFEGHPDPHIWGDPTLWAEAVDAVVDGLSEAAPEFKELFESRGKTYKEELLALHEWAKARMAEIPVPNRILITSHDAFGYFGQAYGLEVIGLQGISTETDASMADLAAAARLIRERQVKAIFVESSVNRATIDRLAKEAGVKIGGELYSDSLGAAKTMHTSGGLTYDAGTYKGMLMHNVNTIVEALK